MLGRRSLLRAETVRIPPRELALLARQWATMLGAGIPIHRATDLLSQQQDTPAQEFVLREITRDVQSGKSTSGSMARFVQTFSPLFVAMVRVGESHGDLAGAFNSVADLLERSEATRQKARAALTYPLLVGAFAFGATWLIFTFLLPQFIDMFEQMHLHLPAVTRIVMLLCRMSRNPLWLLSLAAAVVGAVWAVRRWWSTPRGRLQRDRIAVNLPLFGRMLRLIAQARFMRALSSLLGSGINLAQALKLASDASANELVRLQSRAAIELIMAGESIASSLSGTMFDTLTRNMVLVGEESGTLPRACAKVADYYEREVEYLTENLASLIEPVLTLTLGMVVGVVCVSIFLPLYSLLEQLGS
jgi:type IV pilus assembly protein PilC